MRFYRGVIIAVVASFLITSLAIFLRLAQTFVTTHPPTRELPSLTKNLVTTYTSTTTTTTTPACHLTNLLTTEFSRSHSFLVGDASCSPPLLQQDNQELHPTVASVCSSVYGSSWKLLKHPQNVDYVVSSDQEVVVGSLFFPIAATCKDSAGGLVVDMGTNEGMFAMGAASLGCTVLTFDPQSMCIDILKRALFSFKENEDLKQRMYALNAAASTTQSTLEASIDSCHGCYMTDGSISCGSPTKQPGNWKRTQKIDSLNVATVIQTIGFNEILLLHIDTEGHEISVLRGLEAMLVSKSIKNLIIETRPSTWGSGDDQWIRNALQLAGYKCWQLHNLYNLQNPAILFDAPKPSINLAVPIPACDMFCSVSYSNLDFAHSKKDTIACHDASI